MSKRKPPGYWTKERVMESAAQYNTIREWEQAEGKGPSSMASKLGIRKEATAHMSKKRQGYWTEERLMADAQQYSSRTEWQHSENSSPYQIALRKGKAFLDKCCAHMDVDGMTRKPNKHTRESLLAAAKRFSGRHEWEKGDRLTYMAARYRGEEFMDECCAHMQPAFRWTKELCMEVTAGVVNVAQWQRVSNGSYKAAVENGWYEDCTAHFEDSKYGTDADVVYVWRVSGTDLHKIGLTGDKMGEERIRLCGRDNGMDPRIVFMLKVPDARAVEKQLLELGTTPELDSSIDGYTEFRRLTDADLGKAVSIAYEAALAA